MTDPVLLREVSNQDIQQELLRRTRFNALGGERVHASLLSHRHLWLAALLDRSGVANYAEPGKLFTAGLIKLGDLLENLRIADKRFILTASPEQSKALARVVEEEDWAGKIQVYEDSDEIGRALGVGREGYGLWSVWWD